ncbi:MAG: DUF542 domain-containing protein [Vicinamibacterales bacterium]
MTIATTLAELAVTRPGATRVFHRYRLDFSCRGGRSLVEACRERRLDPGAILAAIEAEAPQPGDLTRWDRVPLSALVDHVVSTVHQRLRDQLPALVVEARAVERRQRGTAAYPRGLATAIADLHHSVLEHLEKEEHLLFPLIVSGQGTQAGGSVLAVERGHQRHAERLADIRMRTADFTAPPSADAAWRGLYADLQQLEVDLMLHMHLENNVLFRRALAA